MFKDDDEVAVIRFAPSDELIACATHDALIYLYETENWTKLGSCRGHSSMVKSIDFAVIDGQLKMQTNDAAKEILYWDLDPTGGSLHLTPVDLRDIEWHDRTCPLGWPVRGVSLVDDVHLFMCVRDEVEAFQKMLMRALTSLLLK